LNLKVLYFARLRDAMGRAADQVEVPPAVRTAGDLRRWLIARGSPWKEAFGEVRAIRVAIDQSMADDSAPLRDGAEIAFFPPVTGG
jgi:sulfur-carrier protein